MKYENNRSPLAVIALLVCALAAAPAATAADGSGPGYVDGNPFKEIAGEDAVTVEINILDPNGVTRAATTRTFTTRDAENDSFTESLTLPGDAPTGTYTAQVIVYDAATMAQQDIWTDQFLVDPSCGTVTPVITDTPTPTASPTSTPTSTFTSTPTPTSTITPTPTSTPSPTSTSAPTLSPASTSSPTPTPAS